MKAFWGKLKYWQKRLTATVIFLSVFYFVANFLIQYSTGFCETKKRPLNLVALDYVRGHQELCERRWDDCDEVGCD